MATRNILTNFILGSVKTMVTIAGVMLKGFYAQTTPAFGYYEARNGT